MQRNRVADYIAKFVFEKLNVNTVFIVSGGGMMFLSDGLALEKRIKVVCSHHEQAAAMGAVAFSKTSGGYGVVFLTTGCGGTNGITALLNAYQDNIPCVFISGQVKRKETVRNSGVKLRQFGVQEADIVSVVEPLTKYSVMVNDPNEIMYHLEKAAYIAKEGRPGPVWIDVPMDVQGAVLDPSTIKHFNLKEQTPSYFYPTKSEIEYVKEKIRLSKRPIIIAGQGVRLSGQIYAFKKFITKHNIPYVVSRLGIDLLPYNEPLFIGRLGNKGDRSGNFAVQNSDLVLVFGSRLSVSTTGHQYESFAREADVIVIDIDASEHKKNTVKIDKYINSDLKDVLIELNDFDFVSSNDWAKRCLNWKQKWQVYQEEYKDDKDGINLYQFVETLSEKALENSIFVSDAGSSFYVVSQGIKLKEGQRYITSGGQAEMGWSLPAAIGVSFANRDANILAVTGDGSLQMNIQELQTLVHYQPNLKLFVWNNDGYLSIRASQKKFFDERYIGTDSLSGVSFPDLEKIANAYGVKYFKVSTVKEMETVLNEVIRIVGPVVCEIMCIRDQEIIPSVASYRKDDGTMISKPIEDMYPFLSRDEFNKEMIIKPLDE
jgi:acetolactate synthase-1/2/3 large subunit